jgi:hypothetical protein
MRVILVFILAGCAPRPLPANDAPAAYGVGGLGVLVPQPRTKFERNRIRKPRPDGGAPPGASPRLLDVVLTPARGDGAAGIAHFTGDTPPFALIASSSMPDYSWRIDPVAEREVRFFIRCHTNRPPHRVDYSFVVEDGYSRTSQAIVKYVSCGRQVWAR